MTRFEFQQKHGPPADRTFRAVDFASDLHALLEAERAKAREEQREACALAVERHDPELDLVAFQVRSTLLTATPLADRIAELKRERDEDREARRQLEANEAKLHEVLGWGGALPPNLPVATRATLEVVSRLRRAERERDEALKLAYVGDHRFPENTYRAKLDELVPKLRQAERERDEWKARALKAEEALADLRDQADAVERWSTRP